MDCLDIISNSRRISTLFPFFVCRVSGLSTNALETLRADRTLALLHDLFSVKEQRRALKETLSPLLYEIVGATQDRRQRNILLQLRRDVHNLRPITAERCADVKEALPTAAAQALARVRESQAREDELRRRIEQAYTEEVEQARHMFLQIIQNSDFQKGLLLSSRTLFSAQKRYMNVRNGRFNSKAEKIERGLLRYASRMAMKATPFGTFCAVIPGRFTEESDAMTVPPLFSFRGDPQQKRTIIRLNKRLADLLLTHLKTRPAVRNRLHVELNPTLHREEDRLVFLTTTKGREVFQRLSLNAVLELVCTLLYETPGIPRTRLIETLIKHPEVEASQEEATAYLDKLIEVGLLRFRTGLGEQEADWDIPLREILEPIDDEHARLAVSLLAQLRQYVEAFADAEVSERAALLKAMNTALEETLETMGLEIRPSQAPSLYEDATAPSMVEIPRSHFTLIEESLRTFVSTTIRLAWTRTEQATMRHFFDTYYRDSAQRVPLLQFYEDYYREHFKGHLEKRNKGQQQDQEEEYDIGNPFKLDFIQTIQEANSRLTNLVAQCWQENPTAEEITLTPDDIEEILKDVPPPADTCRSVSFFAQLVALGSEAESPRLVVPRGSYLVGYGKYFSRFLYLFPDEVKTALYEANQTLTNQYLAEICGDANFNANLHPPLLRWEISYPTGESGRQEEQLLSSSLHVISNPDDPHSLCLQHRPTGKQVLPVDLGFMNPRMRPPLYQLLSHFTPFGRFLLHLPETPFVKPNPALPNASEGMRPDVDTNAKEHAGVQEAETSSAPVEPEPVIQYRPRIMFNGLLVLARRRWRVPDLLFPVRNIQETDLDYFIRVQHWRREHGLPEEGYVRIHPLPSTPAERSALAENGRAKQETTVNAPGIQQDDAGDGEVQVPGEARQPASPKTAVSRALGKPQYIDFRSPRFVGLLGTMTESSACE